MLSPSLIFPLFLSLTHPHSQYIHACTQTHLHTHTHTHMHTTNTYKHIPKRSTIHIPTNACAHIHTNTHRTPRLHTFSNTHTHSQGVICLTQWSSHHPIPHPSHTPRQPMKKLLKLRLRQRLQIDWRHAPDAAPQRPLCRGPRHQEWRGACRRGWVDTGGRGIAVGDVVIG